MMLSTKLVCAATVSLLTVAMVGCTATRTTVGGLVTGVEGIQSGGRVFVISVADGVEATDGPSEGSGLAVTAAVRDALVHHGYAPRVGAALSLENGLREAKDLGYTYVLRGVIAEWEDNATEWSGRPDVAALSVEVYETETQSLVGAATHRIKGGDSGKQPIRFVVELADHALGKVFGWEPTVITRY